MGFGGFRKVKIKILKHKKGYKITAIVILCILICLLFFSIFINPILKNTIELRSKSLATTAMNSAIGDVVMNSIVYDDLINIVTDELGNITMIQAKYKQKAPHPIGCSATGRNGDSGSPRGRGLPLPQRRPAQSLLL